MSDTEAKKIAADYADVLYEDGRIERVKMKPKWALRAERSGMELDSLEAVYKMAFWATNPRGSKQEFEIWMETVDGIERSTVEEEDPGPLAEGSSTSHSEHDNQ